MLFGSIFWHYFWASYCLSACCEGPHVNLPIFGYVAQYLSTPNVGWSIFVCPKHFAPLQSCVSRRGAKSLFLDCICIFFRSCWLFWLLLNPTFSKLTVSSWNGRSISITFIKREKNTLFLRSNIYTYLFVVKLNVWKTLTNCMYNIHIVFTQWFPK